MRYINETLKELGELRRNIRDASYTVKENLETNTYYIIDQKNNKIGVGFQTKEDAKKYITKTLEHNQVLLKMF